MKLKATKKEILNGYKPVIKVGYCQIQTLLNTSQAFAYSCGVYGWSCDYYDFKDAIISTGYAPVGKPAPFEICKKYEKQAEEITMKYWKIDEQKPLLNELLNKFICDVLEYDE